MDEKWPLELTYIVIITCIIRITSVTRPWGMGVPTCTIGRLDSLHIDQHVMCKRKGTMITSLVIIAK